MRHTLALAVTACLFSVAFIPRVAAQQNRSVDSAAMEQVMEAIRSEMQTNRADVMAKNLPLTVDQAAKFWPVYQAYQKEQNVVMDEHLRDVQRYIESFDTLDDAGALALVKAHLDREAKMVSLRRKALGDFQKAVGAKLAARAIQIDSRLSLVYQTQIVAKIPLVH